MTESPRRVLVPIADGTEEMEFTIVVDVLRRAGVEVVTAGLDGPDAVVCSRGVSIVPDCALAEAEWPFDLVVLPGGGEGTARFRASTELGGALVAHVDAGGDIAAICAAPTALLTHGVGRGRPMTAHPSVREFVAASASWRDDAVVEDGRLVTSQGPGTAFRFALTLVRRLCGPFVADRVRAGLVLTDG